MDNEKLKIIFIAGHTRSGSTLLDRLLGQVDAFFSIGEAKGAWDVFEENWLCECEKPVRDCEFWKEVADKAFGGFSNSKLNEIKKLQQAVARIRHLLLLIFPFLQSQKYRKNYKKYLEILHRFYKAIWDVSGKKIIVDSSKNAAHGFFLSQLEDVDLRIIHLVRDSRAVAYSWQRKRIRPEVRLGNALQKRYGPVASALQWLWGNIAAELLSCRVAFRTRIHYEDLANHPKKIIFQIFKNIRIDEPKINFFINEKTAYLKTGHTVFGNPMRMKRGVLEIKPDKEWEKKMPFLFKAIVSFFTWPLLFRYGYF